MVASSLLVGHERFDRYHLECVLAQAILIGAKSGLARANHGHSAKSVFSSQL
jgi:hypothetical protein